jgi:hypothetical protein
VAQYVRVSMIPIATNRDYFVAVWRQLCNAIAAPSTDALKRSSWYRMRVTRSAQSAELL